jgi:redox-sensing transcriptional repressor
MRKVAESTIRRLSLYLRFLEEFDARGVATVSSDELASRGGTTSAQVRKDLSFFGSFGKRGMGYAVPEMVAKLREILGLGRRWRVALLGAGKIGSALIEHHGFRERGFDIVAVFDNDPRKVGTAWNGLTVQDESGLEAELRRSPVEIAILAVPADAAQPLADRLAEVGVTAILNVAPVQLVVPPEVEVKTVSLAMELEALSFALTNR